jgi:hypothetical protein
MLVTSFGMTQMWSELSGYIQGRLSEYTDKTELTISIDLLFIYTLLLVLLLPGTPSFLQI